jgi:tellurite resistance protein
VKFASLDAVSQPLGVMLSAMAGAGHGDPREAEAAFRRGADSVKQGQLAYDNRFGLESLDAALETLRSATPQVKRRVIDAATATVAADGTVTIDEAELLRSFAAVLDCPMPPLIDAVMNSE